VLALVKAFQCERGVSSWNGDRCRRPCIRSSFIRATWPATCRV